MCMFLCTFMNYEINDLAVLSLHCFLVFLSFLVNLPFGSLILFVCQYGIEQLKIKYMERKTSFTIQEMFIL